MNDIINLMFQTSNFLSHFFVFMVVIPQAPEIGSNPLHCFNMFNRSRRLATASIGMMLPILGVKLFTKQSLRCGWTASIKALLSCGSQLRLVTTGDW